MTEAAAWNQNVALTTTLYSLMLKNTWSHRGLWTFDSVSYDHSWGSLMSRMSNVLFSVTLRSVSLTFCSDTSSSSLPSNYREKSLGITDLITWYLCLQSYSILGSAAYLFACSCGVQGLASFGTTFHFLKSPWHFSFLQRLNPGPRTC